MPDHKHRAVIVGCPGMTRLYIDVPREEALRRFASTAKSPKGPTEGHAAACVWRRAVAEEPSIRRNLANRAEHTTDESVRQAVARALAGEEDRDIRTTPISEENRR